MINILLDSVREYFESFTKYMINNLIEWRNDIKQISLSNEDLLETLRIENSTVNQQNVWTLVLVFTLKHVWELEASSFLVQSSIHITTCVRGLYYEHCFSEG